MGPPRHRNFHRITVRQRDFFGRILARPAGDHDPLALHSEMEARFILITLRSAPHRDQYRRTGDQQKNQ